MPITVVWLAINVGQGYKRTVAFAIVIAVGNCGGFISSNVFITAAMAAYHTGFTVGMGMILLSVMSSSLMYVGLWSGNRKRDKKALSTEPGQRGAEFRDEKHDGISVLSVVVPGELIIYFNYAMNISYCVVRLSDDCCINAVHNHESNISLCQNNTEF